MRKGMLIIVAFLVAVIMLVGMVGCGPAAPETKGPIKLSYQTHMTGPMKEMMGDAIFAGFDLAVMEANEAGGILGRPVVGTRYDMYYTVEESLRETKQAIADGVHALLGYTEAGMGTASIPLAEEAGIPMVVGYGACEPASEIDAAGNSVHPTVFHINGYVPQYIGGIAKWAEQQGYKTFAAMNQDSEYGHIVVDFYKERWDVPGSPVKLTDTFYYEWGVVDVGPELTRLVAGNPDAMHSAMWGTPGVIFVCKKIRELGYEGPVFLGLGSIYDKEIQDVGPELIEGFMCPATWFPDETLPANQKFCQDFENMHGYAPASYSAVGYTATKSILLAMEKAGTSDDAQKIADAMFELDFETPWGIPIKFLPGGHMWYSYSVLLQAKGGKTTAIKVPLNMEDYKGPFNWYELLKGDPEWAEYYK